LHIDSGFSDLRFSGAVGFPSDFAGILFCGVKKHSSGAANVVTGALAAFQCDTTLAIASVRRCPVRHVVAATLSLVFDGKSSFQSDLPMRDLIAVNVAADFADLKPPEVANARAGATKGGVDRAFNGVLRRACQLDQFVNVVGRPDAGSGMRYSAVGFH
jgi:hypothetical protein